MCDSCIERTFSAGNRMRGFRVGFTIASRMRVLFYLCDRRFIALVLARRVQDESRASYEYTNEDDGGQNAEWARKCAFFVRGSILIMNILFPSASRIFLHRNLGPFLLRTLLRELVLLDDALPRPV